MMNISECWCQSGHRVSMIVQWTIEFYLYCGTKKASQIDLFIALRWMARPTDSRWHRNWFIRCWFSPASLFNGDCCHSRCWAFSYRPSPNLIIMCGDNEFFAKSALISHLTFGRQKIDRHWHTFNSIQFTFKPGARPIIISPFHFHTKGQ